MFHGLLALGLRGEGREPEGSDSAKAGEVGLKEEEGPVMRPPSGRSVDDDWGE